MVARPVFTGNHGEVGTEFALGIIQAREFAERHAVSHGHRVESDEARWTRHHRAFHAHAPDRVDAVEHEEFFLGEGGGFQRGTERGGVSVEPRADILDVEDERIDLAQLLRLGRAGADHGQVVVGGTGKVRPRRGIAVEAVNG